MSPLRFSATQSPAGEPAALEELWWIALSDNREPAWIPGYIPQMVATA